jgi:hypothetical protein
MDGRQPIGSSHEKAVSLLESNLTYEQTKNLSGKKEYGTVGTVSNNYCKIPYRYVMVARKQCCGSESEIILIFFEESESEIKIRIRIQPLYILSEIA